MFRYLPAFLLFLSVSATAAPRIGDESRVAISASETGVRTAEGTPLHLLLNGSPVGAMMCNSPGCSSAELAWKGHRYVLNRTGDFDNRIALTDTVTGETTVLRLNAYGNGRVRLGDNIYRWKAVDENGNSWKFEDSFGQTAIRFRTDESGQVSVVSQGQLPQTDQEQLSLLGWYMMAVSR